MHRGIFPRASVVKRQPFPYFARLHVNDSVFVGVISVCPPKDLYADRAFLQAMRQTSERLLHDVSKEILAALARAKLGALEEVVQFGSDRAHLDIPC